MTHHTLSQGAKQIMTPYKRLKFTIPIFDLDTLHFDFGVEECQVTGMKLRYVGNAIDQGEIGVFIDPTLQTAGLTDEFNSRVRIIFPEDYSEDFDLYAESLVIHEATHASFRWNGFYPTGTINEATAYIAQAAYFAAKGATLFGYWKGENADLINQPWMDENSYEPLAYVYREADRLVANHQVVDRCARLNRSQVKDLIDAILNVPAYNDLGRAKVVPGRSGPKRRRWRMGRGRGRIHSIAG